MSRYIVRVVGSAAGMETYLARGREVGSEEVATHYAHPSNAWQAADAYRAKAPRVHIYMDVLDTRDEENRVPFE